MAIEFLQVRFSTDQFLIFSNDERRECFTRVLSIGYILLPEIPYFDRLEDYKMVYHFLVYHSYILQTFRAHLRHVLFGDANVQPCIKHDILIEHFFYTKKLLKETNNIHFLIRKNIM